ncbi:hypothetical protein PINS_up009009 [Pythium insidiosum]|nr:hypothetical protein PINS_up009009 [Pythium insidiosum]
MLADEGDAFGLVGGTPLLKRRKTVVELHGVRSLVCGDRFAIGVCSGSDLYCWGAAPLGRAKSSPTPLPLTPLGADPSPRVAVQRVACGLHHAVLLFGTGKLLAWGSNVHGQLGLGSHRSVLDAHEPHPTPVQLPGSSAALDIACGDHHTVVLTDTGGLVAFGNNWHGQLGLDPTTTDSGCVFEATRVFWWRPLVGQREDDGDAEMASELPLPLPMPSSSSGGQSPSKKPPASASPPHRGKPPTTAYQPSAPRVYLLTAIGDTTAIVDEHGHVYVWGMCVAPGAFAGAAGLVGRWIPQRVDVAADSNSGGASAAIVRRRVVMEGGTAAPWSSIAVANGLVVLVRHSVSSSAAGDT